ncbi:hypothetical protein ACIQOV_37070, partial [Kitasatospora sp. NPDC091257]|uniref:hypothetical protein n=1 Tax=Kitasatospora sp. NPDC091257 TaxID=3364084 RepID=UPI0037FA6A21
PAHARFWYVLALANLSFTVGEVIQAVQLDILQSKALIDVLNTARADMGDRVAETMSGFSGLGETLAASMTGGTELDDLFAPLRQMRPGFADAAAAEERRKRDRQEEFRG